MNGIFPHQRSRRILLAPTTDFLLSVRESGYAFFRPGSLGIALAAAATGGDNGGGGGANGEPADTSGVNDYDWLTRWRGESIEGGNDVVDVFHSISRH